MINDLSWNLSNRDISLVEFSHLLLNIYFGLLSGSLAKSVLVIINKNIDTYINKKTDESFHKKNNKENMEEINEEKEVIINKNIDISIN